MTRLAILATADDAALHGLTGTFAWGEARTFTPDDTAALSAYEPQLTIALGDVAPDAAVAVRWSAGAAPAASGEPRVAPGGQAPAASGEPRVAPGGQAPVASGGPFRVVATAGEGLWRRAPLPANDALGALRARPGAGVLVVGGGREAGVAALRERGVDVCEAARMTLDDLAAAAIVVLAGATGEPLPAAAPAVIAAGRLLIVPRSAPAFGFLPDVDHLAYDDDGELAQLADAAATYPHAFEAIVAMGALTATAQLASAVYGRAVTDLRLEAVTA